MDWSNESYVKLFIRESADEHRMEWKAWALFQKILRHSDRSGILDFDGDDDIPVLAATARMPADVVAAALPRILRTGAVQQRDGHLFVVNKLKASDASKSNALRQQEKREKRAAEGNRPKSDTERVVATQSVSETTQSVSQTTQADTARHSATQRDHISRAEQSLAELSRAEQSISPLPPGESAVADKRPRACAVYVCEWIARYKGKRPRSGSKPMVALGKSLAKYTDEQIRAGLELKDSEWHGDYQKYWGKSETVRRMIPSAVADAIAGSKPREFSLQRDITVGYAPPASHEELQAEHDRGRKF